MPPKRNPDEDVEPHQIDRTPEYEAFIEKLDAFHKQRGTTLEREPRLAVDGGHLKVDLLKLYEITVENGGFDDISGRKTAWQSIARDLGLVNSANMGQLGFQLKQDFLRYLGAYWVKDQYNKEPPPKEILENYSAASKWGPILTRTVENFEANKPSAVDQTPVKESRTSENTPVSGNRASGRLREAPPQRIPFQPETGPSRVSRTNSSQHAIPQSTPSHAPHPSHNQHHLHQAQQPAQHQQHHHTPHRHDPTNPLHLIQAQQAALRGASSAYAPPPNTENASRLDQAFDPRPAISVPLRPVNTPGNNPVEFSKRQRQLVAAAGVPGAPAAAKFAVAGVGAEGPNIYDRCLRSLRSGLPAEQAFALSHLVKISFERGDKFKFEAFLGLAEGLIEKALEIGSLFYHVEWQVDYFSVDDTSDISILDGVNGTEDILERIQRLPAKTVLDYMQSSPFADQLTRITEAVLTIRNLVMMPDNAQYMSDVCSLRDLLCILLNLPNLEMLVELKHFALDIAEQLTPFLNPDSRDPLYRTLLAQLDSTDRGTILTALRAISRIAINSTAVNKLQDVPPAVLQNIMNWLLLNDEELMDACLDFLYQYSAVVTNVNSLLQSVNMERVVPHLVRLLAHGAKRVKEDYVLEPEYKIHASQVVPAVPYDLQQRLASMDEPQRCFSWLQSLFEEDSESHITQIAIWQAYQSSLSSSAPRNTLSAADFIRNVSHVFVPARAQIIRGPGEVQRFIIEGIRARVMPLDYETKEEYSRCEWITARNPSIITCGSLHAGSEKMWQHILKAHLGQIPTTDGKFEDKELETRCYWAGCTKFPSPIKMQLSQLTRHIKTHIKPAHQKRALNDASETVAKRPRKAYIVPAKTMTIAREQTLITRDEKNPAIQRAGGIPYSAVLVLRNIARNVVKTESQEVLIKEEEEKGPASGWNEKLFRPVMARLFEVMTENIYMAEHVSSLLQLVQQEV